MKAAPAMFISHGSPLFALEPGLLGPRLRAVGQSLDDVAAALVVSAHWMTPGVRVMTTSRPETVHDFFGFPEALYRLAYPASGHPALAEETVKVLKSAGFDVAPDDARGLDHGAWVPLKVMYPDADIPVLQLSMPTQDPEKLMEIGRRLRPLRDEGVLIIGSGFMTHGLRYVTREMFEDNAVPGWSKEFDHWVAEALERGDLDTLADFRRAPGMPYAHPTVEHYTPLFIALGAATDPEAPPTTVIDDFQFGFAKRSVQFA